MFFIHVPCISMCIVFYFSFIWLHVYAFAINSMVHCGSAFEPNAHNKWESRGRHLWQSGGRDMESRHSWRQEICREGPTDQMSKTCQGGPNCIVVSVHVGRAESGGASAPEPPRATGVRPEFLRFCPFSWWLNLGGFLFPLLFFTFFEIGLDWSPIVGWTDVIPPSNSRCSLSDLRFFKKITWDTSDFKKIQENGTKKWNWDP